MINDGFQNLILVVLGFFVVVELYGKRDSGNGWFLYGWLLFEFG